MEARGGKKKADAVLQSIRGVREREKENGSHIPKVIVQDDLPGPGQVAAFQKAPNPVVNAPTKTVRTGLSRYHTNAFVCFGAFTRPDSDPNRAYKSSRFRVPKNYHGNLFLNYRRHNVVGVPVVYIRLYRSTVCIKIRRLRF